MTLIVPDKSLLRRPIRVLRGQVAEYGEDGPSPKKVDCEEVVKLALAMDEHSYFFSRRRSLSIHFSRDLNGSGEQGISIHDHSAEKLGKLLIQVVFDVVGQIDDEFLYEADLIRDRGKDYEPTVNLGRHRFQTKFATLWVDWHSDRVQNWRRDLERLSLSPTTLIEWIDNDLDMLVSCRSRKALFCENLTIISKKDLEVYASDGLNLEDLQARLRCSSCGERHPKIRVFPARKVFELRPAPSRP